MDSTNDPSACTSPGADASPSLATPAAGVQTDRPVWLHADGVLDLDAIVARVRSRPAIAPRATVAGYLPASPFDDDDRPEMMARSEHAVRVHRGWSDALDAGGSW